MAVKFDKEMIIKNHFWIVLFVTVALTTFGLIYLNSISAVEQAKKFAALLDKGKSSASGATAGPQVVAEMAKHAETAKQRETELWKACYLEQQPLFTWPPEFEKKYDFYAGKFANEISISKPLPKEEWPADSDFLMHGTLTDVNVEWIKIEDRHGKEQMLRRTQNIKIALADDPNAQVLWNLEGLPTHRGKLLAIKYQTGKYFNDILTLSAELPDFAKYYKNQVPEILKIVDPLDEKGNGVVQLRNWLYRDGQAPEKGVRFIRFVNADWFIRNDFSAETWIAQEDLWIQKEIYRIIKSVNDDIKVCQGKGGEERDKPYIFRNTTFELEIVLHKDDTLSFKVKNLLDRRQQLDVGFRVWLNNGPGAEPEVIRVSGLPLMPKGAPNDFRLETIKVSDEGKTAPRKGVYRVEFMMTWESAAIKRIDHISIGSVAGDDNSFSQRNSITPLRSYDPKDMEEKKDAGKGGEVIPGGAEGDDALGGGGAAVGSNRKATKHGLWTHRYIEVTPQSRRLPVAVALIVDQDYVDRVLTAFINSKLRFVETQVLLNQYSGSLQPLLPDEKKDNEPIAGGEFPPRFNPAGGGFGGVKKIGAQPAGGGALETNMELVIYGVMTLYQRYPPRPRPEAAKE